MKKIIIPLFLLLVLLSLTIYKHSDKTSQAPIIIGASSKFTQEELNSAVQSVKQRFKDFEGCKLTKLWYDEEKSNRFIEGYLQHGKGSTNGVTASNVVVLLSDFDVDSSGGDGSLNPNSTYTDWKWILIRDDGDKPWRVDDWGY